MKEAKQKAQEVKLLAYNKPNSETSEGIDGFSNVVGKANTLIDSKTHLDSIKQKI